VPSLFAQNIAFVILDRVDDLSAHRLLAGVIEISNELFREANVQNRELLSDLDMYVIVSLVSIAAKRVEICACLPRPRVPAVCQTS
jgi:hypothetical protein